MTGTRTPTQSDSAANGLGLNPEFSRTTAIGTEKCYACAFPRSTKPVRAELDKLTKRCNNIQEDLKTNFLVLLHRAHRRAAVGIACTDR